MEEVEVYAKPQENSVVHSSKGNQTKWFFEGFWYKADGLGYESLSEVVCSKILACSTVLDVTLYEPVSIWYEGRNYRGCRSRNFKKQDEILIPVERLYRSYTGGSLAQDIMKMSDISSRIRFMVEFVERATGLEQFGSYLTAMLEMDAFFLNEDRHTNNIAILYNEKEKSYRLCPYFDMGMSLCADTREDYPLDKDYLWCMEQVKAKPFSRDFDEQMDVANELYGRYLQFHITSNQMVRIAEQLKENSYDKAEINRVTGIIRQQARKYQHFMPGRHKPATVG